MAREIIIHDMEDWSLLDQKDELWARADLSGPDENFGIHLYQGRVWSGGYVGVGRIFDKNKRPVQSGGKEHIVVIKPRYGIDPWSMLEAVMSDGEYEDYLEELERDGKCLFRVFYDQPLIRLAQDRRNESDLLYALSFVTSCFLLCKKGLKKTLFHQEENYSSKIRGRIALKKNIRVNTCRGRGDRFYCKYIDFTEDNPENRILKATLLKCKAILQGRFRENRELNRRIAYCANAFRGVKTVRVRSSDFSAASASGLYMYYKPLLKQARCIYSQKYCAYAAEDGSLSTRSVFTIPYMINMESLFELYARTMLKRAIDRDRYTLAPYSRKLFLQQGATCAEDSERGVHLMAYCVPDMIICDAAGGTPVCVLDAKYKSYARTARADSHQLLSYVLLTGAARCGFVFPGTDTEIREMKTSGGEYLPLNAAGLRYYELVLGDTLERDVLQRLLDG